MQTCNCITSEHDGLLVKGVDYCSTGPASRTVSLGWNPSWLGNLLSQLFWMPGVIHSESLQLRSVCTSDLGHSPLANQCRPTGLIIKGRVVLARTVYGCKHWKDPLVSIEKSTGVSPIQGFWALLRAALRYAWQEPCGVQYQIQIQKSHNSNLIVPLAVILGVVHPS